MESPFLLYPLKGFSGVLKANLKGAEKKRTLQKHPFGRPFLRTTPSPLLWRALLRILFLSFLGFSQCFRDFPLSQPIERTYCQRKRDDNKNKICGFQGGVGRGAEGKIVPNAIFHGKRHDKKILKVKMLLSRNFVVMAQAPIL